MIVYVVQYHSNAWADQMVSDSICGIYSTEEAANKRAAEFREKYIHYDDDDLSVVPYTLDKEYPGCGDEAYDIMDMDNRGD